MLTTERGSADLKPGKIVSVVGHSHLIGLGITNPQPALGVGLDFLFLDSTLRFFHHSFLAKMICYYFSKRSTIKL